MDGLCVGLGAESGAELLVRKVNDGVVENRISVSHVLDNSLVLRRLKERLHFLSIVLEPPRPVLVDQ